MNKTIRKEFRVDMSEVPELFSKSKTLLSGNTLTVNELSDETIILCTYLHERNERQIMLFQSSSLEILYRVLSEYYKFKGNKD